MNIITRPKTFGRFALIFPLLLATAGAYTVGECLVYGIGSVLKPGAGFWPFLMGSMLIVCAAVLIVKENKESAGAGERLKTTDYLRIAAITGVFLIWGAVGETLGWLVATGLLAYTVTKIFGMKGVVTPLCQSVLITGVCYLLFGILFTIDLPPAIPEFLLR